MVDDNKVMGNEGEGARGKARDIILKVCPCCGKEVGDEHFSCSSGAKGGAAGVGAVKARSSEQARLAVKARWDKARGKGVVRGCVEVGDNFGAE